MFLRLRTVVLGSLAAFLVRAHEAPPEPKSAEGLASMLGRAAGGAVRTADIAWEPSPGGFAQLLGGRRVLFLSSHDHGPRNLFRATVRLTMDGRPVAISDLHNLSSTPIGDEQELVALGHRAAFAIRAYGRVGQVTALDLREQGATSELSAIDRLMSVVTNVQQTGSARGVHRTDVVLDAPEPHVALAFEPDGRLSITAEGGRVVQLDASTHSLLGDLAQLPAHVSLVPELVKSPVLWAVDTARAELGPAPIAWLEERVFGVRDWMRRLRYVATDDSEHLADAPALIEEDHAPQTSDTAVAPARSLDAAGLAAEDSQWPPGPIPSIWRTTERGEGVWEPVLFPWLRRLPGAVPAGSVAGQASAAGPPPYFYKTMIRPDPVRPYARVLIVAIDPRQVELDMEGGVEDPVSLTGAHGTGRIPRDPKILTRVVGAFNGAFKTTHGEYGMMVGRRVLLPPKPQAATLVVTRDHRVGLGTWGASSAIPEDLVSFRQNLDPIVQDGKSMPSGRTQWGYQLPGTSMFTVRSGVCSTAAGYLYYVWGEELSGVTLAKAMLQAGCDYGMHLDMNPHHTAFMFASVRSMTGRDYEAKLLTPAMEVAADRYLEWSPKDFFYLMLRDTRPTGELAWTSDGAVQPAPAWLPSVWQAARAGAAGGAVSVKVIALDPERVAWRLTGPSRPDHRVEARAEARPEPHSRVAAGLDSDELHRVLAALGLGTPARDGKASGEPGSLTASLRIDGSGRLSLSLMTDEPRPARPADSSSASASVMLPALVKDGVLTATALERHLLRRRGALCVAPSGHVVVASSTAASDQPIAEALRQVGCTLVVGLDRGAHQPWMWDRAGSASPPLSHYPQSVLYAIGVAMAPSVFRFGSNQAVRRRP